MKHNKGFSLIKLFIIVIVLMAVVVGFTYFSGGNVLQIVLNNLAYFQPFGSAVFKQTPEMKSFSVSNKKFVVKGNYLNKVEIWYDIKSIDSASPVEQKILEIKSKGDIGMWQTLTTDIPCGPFSITKIFARAYDNKDYQLNTDIPLPFQNEQDIYENITKQACLNNEQIDLRDGFFLTDSLTGLNVSNPVFDLKGKKFTEITAFVDYIKTLPSGSYAVMVSADGYKNSTMTLSVPGILSNVVFNLNPIKNLKNIPVQAKNKIRIYGFITDEIHNPVPGVLVTLTNYGITTTSGDDGLYYMDISPQTADLCTNNTLTFSKDRYQSQTITNFGSGYIKTDYEGTNIKTQIALKRGTGEQISDQKYHMCP